MWMSRVWHIWPSRGSIGMSHFQPCTKSPWRTNSVQVLQRLPLPSLPFQQMMMEDTLQEDTSPWSLVESGRSVALRCRLVSQPAINREASTGGGSGHLAHAPRSHAADGREIRGCHQPPPIMPTNLNPAPGWWRITTGHGGQIGSGISGLAFASLRHALCDMASTW